jgi:hypothetical protein
MNNEEIGKQIKEEKDKIKNANTRINELREQLKYRNSPVINIYYSDGTFEQINLVNSCDIKFNQRLDIESIDIKTSSKRWI